MQFIQRQRVLGLWREIVRALHSKNFIPFSFFSFCSDAMHIYTMMHMNYCSLLTISLPEVPKSPTRNELRDYARQEFERNRNVEDLVSSSPVIRWLA